jgi:negative regulator of genetic competence, sporulation and motility
MLDELLEKVEETKDFLLNEFNEVEREQEKEIMEYIVALSYIESVIDYFK